MIQQFDVSNYKSLKNVSVKLSNLVVIFGPNAAGKSNLFDALNLCSRLVKCKNLKEAFDVHRGFPLESVHYSTGSVSSLLEKEYHDISFQAIVRLSDQVVHAVESKVRDLRKSIDSIDKPTQDKTIITHKLLKYKIIIQVSSRTGQVRVMDERLSALRNDGTEKTSRTPFIERVNDKICLRMEGHARPTLHDVGLDYSIASTSLYAPHYPHITALKEELSRCSFYYFEPRVLMRQGNAIANVINIGPYGEDLAAFYFTLSELYKKQFDSIKKAAKQILPRLKELEIEKTEKAELFIKVTEGNASFSNRLISEGTLRVLGLLAALSEVTSSTTIGYEEPENGVHPRRLQKIAELLKNASNKRQILINTHSPTLVKYFSDKELLVCKQAENGTEYVPFKSIGPLWRSTEIEGYLEDAIIRGDYGG